MDVKKNVGQDSDLKDTNLQLSGLLNTKLTILSTYLILSVNTLQNFVWNQIDKNPKAQNESEKINDSIKNTNQLRESPKKGSGAFFELCNFHANFPYNFLFTNYCVEFNFFSKNQYEQMRKLI